MSPEPAKRNERAMGDENANLQDFEIMEVLA